MKKNVAVEKEFRKARDYPRGPMLPYVGLVELYLRGRDTSRVR